MSHGVKTGLFEFQRIYIYIYTYMCKQAETISQRKLILDI